MSVIQTIIIVVLIVTSILGILLVLVQSSRGGGGLFGDASASQSVIGTERRGDFFSKLTSILLGIFIGGSFLLAYLKNMESKKIVPKQQTGRTSDSFEDITKGKVKEIPKLPDAKKKEAPKKEEAPKSDAKKEGAEAKAEKAATVETKTQPESAPAKAEDKPAKKEESGGGQ